MAQGQTNFRLLNISIGVSCLLPFLLVMKSADAMDIERFSTSSDISQTDRSLSSNISASEVNGSSLNADLTDPSRVSNSSSNGVISAISERSPSHSSSFSTPSSTLFADASMLTTEMQTTPSIITQPSSFGASSLNSEGPSRAATGSLMQVTSVTQLSDVQPTDWAFQALQSLVERYGCIVGYPDGTYRGSRALTRYEFAAGLNACLDRVSELIAEGLTDTVTRDDLATLQRLQEEFAAELAALRGRVDALEARTAELEANQFSTTTTLNGEVIFSLAGATGGVDDSEAQVVFNNRVRLNLNTSFTGSDLLITGLQASNFGGGFDNPSGSIPGALGLGDPVFGTASNVSLGTAPEFGRTNPSDLSSQGINDLVLYKLLYIFPVANRLTMFVASNVEVTDAFPAIAPFADDSQGAISRFATTDNPVIRVSGGTSDIGLASAAGFIWTISDDIDLRALYGSVNASIAQNNGLLSNNPTPLGAGLFNGSYVASSQLTIKPTDTLTLGLNYAHSYHQINILGTGLSSSDIGSVLFAPNTEQLSKTGGNGVLAVLNEGIQMDSIGATLNWQFLPKVDLTLSGGYIFADLVDVDASTNFVSWLAGLHFSDVFGEGNSAALIFGQPLNRDSTGGESFNPENADPYHLEAYVNLRMNDNISVTPGVFAVFNPEGNEDNDTAVVGVVRTTFTF